MAGVRHEEALVKAVGEEVVLVGEPGGEHAEKLAGQRHLVHAVVEVQACQGTPADVQRGVDVGVAPLHDLDKLVPVVDVLEVHLLHGGTGNDERVVAAVAKRLEGVVELDEVVVGGVLALVARHAHEVHVHLQRRLGNEAQDLRLRLDLLGHEVEQHDPQRAHMLLGSDVLLKREDALVVKNLLGRKSGGDVDRHEGSLGEGTWLVQGRFEWLEFPRDKDTLSDGQVRRRTTRGRDMF